MAITPPLMRLGPGEEALVRTIYAGQGLPADRESLFWIIIQEIPPSSDAANALQVAIRTRIKLFYRPPQPKTTLAEAARALQWRISRQALPVPNPGPLKLGRATCREKRWPYLQVPLAALPKKKKKNT